MGRVLVKVGIILLSIWTILWVPLGVVGIGLGEASGLRATWTDWLIVAAPLVIWAAWAAAIIIRDVTREVTGLIREPWNHDTGEVDGVWIGKTYIPHRERKDWVQ